MEIHLHNSIGFYIFYSPASIIKLGTVKFLQMLSGHYCYCYAIIMCDDIMFRNLEPYNGCGNSVVPFQHQSTTTIGVNLLSIVPSATHFSEIQTDIKKS